MPTTITVSALWVVVFSFRWRVSVGGLGFSVFLEYSGGMIIRTEYLEQLKLLKDQKVIKVRTGRDYLAQSYLIYPVSRYGIKGKKLLTTNDKYYVVDWLLRGVE
jgi:hypothetical protein